jgi:putative DNA-invertase from lambdoid prophage Rac
MPRYLNRLAGRSQNTLEMTDEKPQCFQHFHVLRVPFPKHQFSEHFMKAAIYARVSTDKQTHDSQLNELREYCLRRDWTNVTEYCDTISGSKFSRAALDRLMTAVRRGKVDVVVCFKLDRLGRSLPHLAQIVGELTRHQVALVCPSQGIDTSGLNPASQLQLNILMAIAEFERSIIQERVSAGLRAAKAKGVKLGRPSTLDQHGSAVRQLVAKGLGVREIARRLNVPVSSAFKLVRLAQVQGANL